MMFVVFNEASFLADACETLYNLLNLTLNARSDITHVLGPVKVYAGKVDWES